MSPRLQVAVILFLLAVLVLLLPVLPGHEFDNHCWVVWATYIQQHSLQDAYGSGTDYVPLYQYVLWGYGKIAGSPAAIEHYIYYLRIVTLAIDLLGLWYIYKWTGKRTKFYVIVLLCFLNVAYLYNTLIWGQVDGIESTFVFISLYYGYKDKLTLSCLFFLLAINFKLQAIVFLPVWGMLYINSLITKPSFVRVIRSVSVVVIAQVLILLPFMQSENGLKKIGEVISTSVGHFPYVSVNAWNVWEFFMRVNPLTVSNSDIWFGNITYKQGGLIMFCTASAILLTPMLIRLIKRIKDPKNEKYMITKEQIWLTSALVIFFFFYLNTEMHERYIHPAFIFIAAYSVSSRNFFPFILFSLAYLLNICGAMMGFDERISLLFDPLLNSILFGINIVYLCFKLYRSFKGDHDPTAIAKPI